MTPSAVRANDTGSLFEIKITATISTDKKRIGVELYASDDVDKTAFNALHSQKAAIEAEFGEPLLWQDLSGKKESRFVLYRPVSIHRTKRSTPNCTPGCSRRWSVFAACSARA
jgi:hypothetical protein